MKIISTFYLASALLLGSSALAATLLVANETAQCPDAGFNSIQGAVDAAAPGDVIQVCPGIYAEQVVIAKPLSLVGIERAEKNAVVVQPSNIVVNADFLGEPTAAIILVRDISGVTIRNITIDGINNGLVCDATFPTMDGIFFRNASGVVESVTIKNILSPQACAFADGLDVLSTGDRARQVTVMNSSIHDYDFVGLTAIGRALSISAMRNVVTGRGPSESGQAGIQFSGGATGLIEENMVTNNVSASVAESGFVSGGIGVFEVKDNTKALSHTRIVRNIVGHSNTGIFVGALQDIGSNGVRALDNTVFDSDTFAGIFVGGNDNVVRGNSITNSGLIDSKFFDRAGVFAQGSNNTIRDNTINEAVTGLLVSPGNNVLQNLIFNTAITETVFNPVAPASYGQASSQQPVVAPTVLRKRPR